MRLKLFLLSLVFTTLLTGGVTIQPASRYFPETGCTVQGRFLTYWQQYGGLAQFGLPLTDQFYDSSGNVAEPLVQYFERAVFEYHPESQPPNDVLLTLLGSQTYQQKYPTSAPDQRASTNNPYYFTVTGKTLGGSFRRYWEQHGGLAVQGYPLSDEFTEVATNGNSYTVQYFERAVFELHPENAGTEYEVLLTSLGVARYRNLVLQTGFYALDVNNAATGLIGGQRGLLLRYRSGRWLVSENVRTRKANAILDVAVPSQGDEWITGLGTYHYRSGQWLEAGPVGSTTLDRFDFLSPDLAWGASGYANGVLLKYNGDNWHIQEYDTKDWLDDVDAVSNTELWAVSRYSWYHYKTTTGAERQFVRDGEFRSISMVTGAEGWIAAGGKNKLYHYDAMIWQPVASPVDQPLNSIHMLDSSTGWAVGEAGTILKYDGTSWQQQSSPTDKNLHAVKMLSANEGWAVGDAGNILHYEDGRWSLYNF